MVEKLSLQLFTAERLSEITWGGGGTFTAIGIHGGGTSVWLRLLI